MSWFLNMKTQKGCGRLTGTDPVEVRPFVSMVVSDLPSPSGRKESRALFPGTSQIKIWHLGTVHGCRFRTDSFPLKKSPGKRSF